MKIGIMQPYFFPYIGYWQLMDMVDEYVILDDVNYIKRGWINRNYIVLNDQPKRINLKIKDASQNRLIKDTEIAMTQNDINTLMSIIKQSYRRAPYFNIVYDMVGDILNYRCRGVSDFLANQIRCLCDYLQISTKIILSSQIVKDNALKGEDRIIEICKRRNADCYVNSIGGKELYHKERFRKADLDLMFLVSLPCTDREFTQGGGVESDCL